MRSNRGRPRSSTRMWVERCGLLDTSALPHPRPQPDPEIENDTIGRLFGETGVARTLDVTATRHTPFPLPQN
jgi:hypothetical protein